MQLSREKLEIAMANSIMTINELGDASNVSRETISKMLSGKANAKPATIGKLAKALQVDVETIIGE